MNYRINQNINMNINIGKINNFNNNLIVINNDKNNSDLNLEQKKVIKLILKIFFLYITHWIVKMLIMKTSIQVIIMKKNNINIKMLNGNENAFSNYINDFNKIELMNNLQKK